MHRSSQQATKGLTLLEIVFGLAILILIGTFTVVLMRRDSSAPSETVAVPELAADRSRPARGIGGIDGEGVPHEDERSAFAGDDDGAYAGEEPWPDDRADSAPPTMAAGATTRTREAIPASAALRDYFGDAFAVAGRPNWDRFISLSRQLDSAQYPEAWSLLQEQPWSRAKEDAVQAFVTQWAGRDPQAALEFAASLASHRQRHAVNDTVVELWAQTDPENALAWYQEQEANGARHLARTHFFKGLYASAPELAMQQVWESDDPRRQSELLRQIFLSSRDADERERGASQLKALFDLAEDPAQRAMLAGMVADVWAADDPMRTIAWAQELDEDPAVQQRIMMASLQAWGRREPGAAMAWAEAEGLSEISTHAVGKIAQSWSRDNPTEMREWINNAAPSTMRDTVVTTRVRDLRYRDPATALRLAESISEAGGRYKTMREIADRWIRKDRNAAAAAVLESSMPTAMKRKYAMKVIPKNTSRRRAPK